MSNQAYYGDLKELARAKRAEFSVVTSAFGLREVRAIYRRERIRIDTRRLSSVVKAIYMCGEEEPSVAVREGLPREPRIFALIHELKHHWVDREAISSSELMCGDYNQNELIEKGAEVFAAEFIYPEDEFAADIVRSRIRQWDVDAIVKFKRNFCRAKVSYTYVRKRLERLGLVQRGQFDKIKFQKREEELYGVPFYKQAWFQQYRKRGRQRLS